VVPLEPNDRSCRLGGSCRKFPQLRSMAWAVDDVAVNAHPCANRPKHGESEKENGQRGSRGLAFGLPR